MSAPGLPPGYPGGDAKHPDITGADGRRYTWDNASSQYVPLAGAPAKTPTAKAPRIFPPTKAHPYWTMENPDGSLRVITQAQALAGVQSGAELADSGPYAGPGSDIQSMPGDPVESQLPRGDPAQSIADSIVSLTNLGGVGGGFTAYQQAELARQDRLDRRQQAQDAINAAIDQLNALAKAQSTYDARQSAAQNYTLKALPDLVPAGQQYFGAGAPGTYEAQMGISHPVSIVHVPFQPNQVGAGNPYDAQIAAALAKLQAIGGAA